jgi:hypothetical protein
VGLAAAISQRLQRKRVTAQANTMQGLMTSHIIWLAALHRRVSVVAAAFCT